MILPFLESRILTYLLTPSYNLAICTVEKDHIIIGYTFFFRNRIYSSSMNAVYVL
jgi:hypothetical protein